MLMDVYDEPFGDSSAFPTMLVSRLAREHVTVTLSGDGGDELFQGYGMYSWASRLQNPLLIAFRQPIYSLSQKMDNRAKRAGKMFNYPSSKRLYTHIFSQEQYFFSEQELDILLANPAFNFTAINTLNHARNGANAAEMQAFWDLKYYLPDDLLVKVDRASMLYSLESRVPLLDIKLVELGLNIDYKLKVRRSYGTKFIMKKVLYEMVPRQIFERPKQGFAIPLKEWLKGPLAYLLDNYLNENIINEFQVIDPDSALQLIKRFKEGEDYLYNRIWLLIVLHWWMDKNK
jgi:asparagine synthase (glutamine-hydrolysing)